MSHVVLRFPEVKGKVKLSRSSIYLRIAKGEFPAPISLGGRAVGWLEADIEHWLEQQIESSRVRD